MEAAVVIALLLLLAWPFAAKRMWRWLGLIVLIAIYEGLLALATGKTLSQEFWAVSLSNPASWTTKMLVVLAAAWGVLLVHLAWKKWRKQP